MASESSITPAMFGPKSAPAMSKNTVSGMGFLGMECAMIGHTAATSTMTASDINSSVI